MPENRARSFHSLTAVLVYLLVFASAISVAAMRSRAKTQPAAEEPVYEEPARRASTKPFFSLQTHRTYGSNDNPKLWVDYQGVDHLDFRVYAVKDPKKFFTELKDPHQMGEDEEEQVANSLPHRKSFLERVRSFKRWAFSGVKTFVRGQLNRGSRSTFNQKFRKEDETSRTPLNVADYARVPLLNPDALVTSWREPLQPLEAEYDKRMIPLGKRQPGVYLVEAVANDLRAYTVVVVTDLTMIDKTTNGGDMMIYAVDRKTGEPRPGAEIEIVREKQLITSGKTDEHGIFKTKIPAPKAKANDAAAGDEEGGEEGGDEAADEQVAEEDNPAAKSLLILAKHSGNFAISDHGALYLEGDP